MKCHNHGLEVVIEKLVYGGDGLARLAEQGGRRQTLFVPFVLPGERVQVQPVEQRPGFVRAALQNIIAASPARVAPGCPYFAECGGCHYQHAAYEEQLRLKASILRETLRRIGKIEIEDIQTHAAEPWNYRNRTRLRVRRSPDFAIGYYRAASHELLAIRTCPISSKLINRAITACWEVEPRILPEQPFEIELFVNDRDNTLQVQLLGAAGPELSRVGAKLREQLPAISGIIIMPANARHAGPTAAPEIETDAASSNNAVNVIGNDSLLYAVDRFQYRVTAGSFFQANRFLVSKLIELATADRSGALAWDLYAGVGLFTLPLAARFDRVIAVEAASSYADLRHNCPPHIKTIQATAEHFLEKAGRKRPDFVVIDPPRAGLGNRVARALAAISPPHIAYVSCDPSTLARDAAVLLGGGYRVQQAHLIDLFPQTFHIETVLHLAR